MSVTAEAYAESLDLAYPLAARRAQLVRPDGLVYLDGNSLGPLPLATRQRLTEFVDDEWGGDLVRGWERWLDLPAQVGDRLGTALLGSGPGQVVVTDSVTVNLYKLAWAALDAAPAGRRVIVTRDDDFPTDRYVLAAVAEQLGGTVRAIRADPVQGVHADALSQALGDDVALVAMSLVAFSSGALADLATVTSRVHDCGARVLWDLSHAVGAVPLVLDEAEVDLAVGCTYKYVCAGPGAPAFLYVRNSLAEELRSPIPGWFAHRDQFAMTPGFAAASGAKRFLAGTPPVAGLLAVDAGVELLGDVTVLREASIALTTYLIQLAAEWLPDFTLASPSDPLRRGGHVTFAHPDAHAISAALIARAGVVTDVRPPDRLRLAPAPLVTSFVDVREGVRRIRDLVASGAY